MKPNENISTIDLLFDRNPKVNIEHDLYGFSLYVDSMKKYLEKCQSPFTISIYGSWGSGKTTLKNFLIEKIIKDQKSTIFPVDFNAWEYEQQTGILIPLVCRLIKLGKFEQAKIKKISSIVTLALTNVLLKASTANMIDLNNITSFEDYANENFSKYAKYVDNVEKTRNDFQEIISGIIKQENKQKKSIEKIVIFIDELDRCNPENALRLLESIKNHFDVEGCIFVILVDNEILASYIDKKYENTKMDGHMYLEKIMNTKFSVPVVTQRHLESLFRKIKLFQRFSDEFSIIFEISELYNPRKISKVIEKIKLLIEKVDDYENKILSSHSPVKDVANNKIELALLVILICELFPELYRDLNSWSDEFCERLKGTIQKFLKDPGTGGIGELKSLVDYNPAEIHVLYYYVFQVFKPLEVFYGIDNILNKLQII